MITEPSLEPYHPNNPLLKYHDFKPVAIITDRLLFRPKVVIPAMSAVGILPRLISKVKPEKKGYDLDDYINLAHKIFGVKVTAFNVNDRQALLVATRNIVIFAMRVINNRSLKQVGRLGCVKKHHATVLHSVQCIKNAMDTHDILSDKYKIFFANIGFNYEKWIHNEKTKSHEQTN